MSLLPSQNKARCKSDEDQCKIRVYIFFYHHGDSVITCNWIVSTFDPLTWRGATKPTMATRAVDAAASPEDKDGNNTTNSSPSQSKKLNRGVQISLLAAKNDSLGI